MRNGERILIHMITARDVGPTTIRTECSECRHGRTYMLGDVLGRILPGDVGKRVYLLQTASGKIVQVENDEQRAART